MVIDSSSVFAILFHEPERELFLLKLAQANLRLVSAANYYEMSTVAISRSSFAKVDEFLESLRIQIVSFDKEQALLAREAYERYGRGRHKVSLNLGDCFAYALAMKTGEPLLFKGNDFTEFKGNDFTETDLEFA